MFFLFFIKIIYSYNLNINLEFELLNNKQKFSDEEIIFIFHHIMDFTLNKLKKTNQISLLSLDFSFYLNNIRHTGMIEKEFKEKNLDKKEYFSIILSEILNQLTSYLSSKSYSGLKSTPPFLFIQDKKKHHQTICSLIYNSFLYNKFRFHSLLKPLLTSTEIDEEKIFISKQGSYLLKYSIYLDRSIDYSELNSDLNDESQPDSPGRSPSIFNNQGSKR